ncbi:MAG: Trm112 family protein [Myxococcaceae bacterium]
MALDPKLLDILACPEDKGPLLYFAADRFLYNPRLRKKYRVEDDVPQMLMEEATPVDATEHQAIVARAEKEGIKPNFTA